MSATTNWQRPTDTVTARTLMMDAESRGDFKVAALAAITLADLTCGRDPADADSLERQAQVYATLHQAEMALWIAENRQPAVMFP